MTIGELILNLESRFTVHHDVGVPALHYDQNDKASDSGARDMTRAPNGEKYVTVVSGGIKEPHDPPPVMFSEESPAVKWFLWAVEDIADELEPARSEWKNLHLYWRDKPVWLTAEYVAIEQAKLLQEASPLADALALGLGYVWSRLLLSVKPPKEASANA